MPQEFGTHGKASDGAPEQALDGPFHVAIVGVEHSAHHFAVNFVAEHALNVRNSNLVRYRHSCMKKQGS